MHFSFLSSRASMFFKYYKEWVLKGLSSVRWKKELMGSCEKNPLDDTRVKQVFIKIQNSIRDLNFLVKHYSKYAF